MSDRERWIVYPLLFLALLQSQRDAWRASYGTAKFNSVQCNSIDVQSQTGETKIRLVGNPNTGLINVYGAGPQRCVAVSTKNGGNSGHLELIHTVKYSGVKLTATPEGGVAELSGSPTVPAVRLGVDPKTKQVGVGPANGHLIPVEIELSDSGLQFVPKSANKENDATKSDTSAVADEGADTEASTDLPEVEQKSAGQSTNDADDDSTNDVDNESTNDVDGESTSDEDGESTEQGAEQ